MEPAPSALQLWHKTANFHAGKLMAFGPTYRTSSLSLLERNQWRLPFCAAPKAFGNALGALHNVNQVPTTSSVVTAPAAGI